MKSINAKIYLLYASFIYGFIFFITSLFKLQHWFFQIREHDYFHLISFNYVLKILDFFGFFIIGTLMGIEMFLIEKKKRGKWIFRYEKFLFLVVPGIILLIINAIYNVSLINYHTEKILLIIMGYSTITAFFKEEQ